MGGYRGVSLLIGAWEGAWLVQVRLWVCQGFVYMHGGGGAVGGGGVCSFLMGAWPSQLRLHDYTQDLNTFPCCCSKKQ